MGGWGQWLCDDKANFLTLSHRCHDYQYADPQTQQPTATALTVWMWTTVTVRITVTVWIQTILTVWIDVSVMAWCHRKDKKRPLAETSHLVIWTALLHFFLEFHVSYELTILHIYDY